jgi:hypothetical protein
MNKQTNNKTWCPTIESVLSSNVRASKLKSIIFTYDYTVFIQTHPIFEEVTCNTRLLLLSLIPEYSVNENSMNDFDCMMKRRVVPEM